VLAVACGDLDVVKNSLTLLICQRLALTPPTTMKETPVHVDAVLDEQAAHWLTVS